MVTARQLTRPKDLSQSQGEETVKQGTMGISIFRLFTGENKPAEVEATQQGDEWMALCPNHDDTDPSLAINPEKGVFYCHGCGFKGSLWDESKRGKPDGDEPDKDESESWLGEVLATFDYCNSRGELLYQTVKLSAPPPKNKTFRQRRPDGKGGWIWNLNGITRVLYRLRELLTGQDPVFICEGEKDVDNVRSLGLTATTNPMGAGKWLDIYNPCLAGRDVVILPDNDMPGTDHAKQVAHSLFGTAKSIKVLMLPDLPVKGDVTDWLEAENKKEGSTQEQIKENFLHMIEEAHTITEEDVGVSPDNDCKGLFEILDEPDEEPDYLVKPILMAQDKGFLVASYKVGKTLSATQLTLCLSKAVAFLNFEVPKPRRVVYVRFELSDLKFKRNLRTMMRGISPVKSVIKEPMFKLKRGFNILDQKDFDWLVWQIDKHEPDLLIFDCLSEVNMSP